VGSGARSAGDAFLDHDPIAKDGVPPQSILVNLDAVLRNNRMTLTELSNRTGLTIANLSILKTGKSRAMRFSTLEILCRTLGCQPGDILSYGFRERQRDRR
jgi:putative transcriptional regulator